MGRLNYSEAGLAMTKNFEGLRLKAYQDVAGIWTVGYGHTGSAVCAGTAVTEDEADGMLRMDLAGAVDCVDGAVRGALTQGQFDGLVDFCFNVGRGAFLQSALLRCVGAGDFVGAAGQFLLWVNAGGKKRSGLVRRRTAERGMFVGGRVAED